MQTIIDQPEWKQFRNKQDMQQAIDQTFKPLKDKFTLGHTGLQLGATAAIHNEAIALMEAFARPLWGLVPYTCGGGESDLWPLFLEGIKNGTNPEHEEYWGDYGTKDQRMVEQSVLGLALALVPEKVWHPLTEQEQHNLYHWLNQINLVDRSNPNNWLMFTVLVNIGFKKIGMPHDQALMEKYLETIDSYYLSDGWYSDGKTDQRDYYIPFAMHYYTLIYAKLMEKDDPKRAEVYRSRAKRFAEDYIYWFSEDGSSIPFGRSLTYRFAQAAFWSAIVYADVDVFTPGIVKGIVLRHLRWWYDQPIFTLDGLLSIGYAYPNLIMAEAYNAPGSAYWAYKTYLLLALPDDHPFWLAEEEELPVLQSQLAEPHARMLITRPEGNKHVVALASGQMANFDMAHSAAKYAKFAYSTQFGFSVPKGYYGLGEGAYDSMLALSERDEHYRVRRFCEEYRIEEQYVYSRWKPWHDVEVETWLIPVGMWHVRIHQIDSSRVLDAAEGGFAIQRPMDHKINEEAAVHTSASQAVAQLPWGVSGIVNLGGHQDGVMVYPEANTNVLKPRTMIPTLTSQLEAGSHLLLSAVFGASASSEHERHWTIPPVIHSEAGHVMIKDSVTNEVVCQIKLSNR